MGRFATTIDTMGPANFLLEGFRSGTAAGASILDRQLRTQGLQEEQRQFDVVQQERQRQMEEARQMRAHRAQALHAAVIDQLGRTTKFRPTYGEVGGPYAGDVLGQPAPDPSDEAWRKAADVALQESDVEGLETLLRESPTREKRAANDSLIRWLENEADGNPTILADPEKKRLVEVMKRSQDPMRLFESTYKAQTDLENRLQTQQAITDRSLQVAGINADSRVAAADARASEAERKAAANQTVKSADAAVKAADDAEKRAAEEYMAVSGKAGKKGTLEPPTAEEMKVYESVQKGEGGIPWGRVAAGGAVGGLGGALVGALTGGTGEKRARIVKKVEARKKYEEAVAAHEKAKADRQKVGEQAAAPSGGPSPRDYARAWRDAVAKAGIKPTAEHLQNLKSRLTDLGAKPEELESIISGTATKEPKPGGVGYTLYANGKPVATTLEARNQDYREPAGGAGPGADISDDEIRGAFKALGNDASSDDVMAYIKKQRGE